MLITHKKFRENEIISEYFDFVKYQNIKCTSSHRNRVINAYKYNYENI